MDAAASVLDLIGRTPLVTLARCSPKGGATIVAKLEVRNPGGSIKDRPALAMISAAEEAGRLVPGATIIEATSGNTGISLAMIAAVRGYRCVLVMPEDMSVERRHVLRAYGADLVLTPAEEGMTGAVQRARALLAERPGAFMPCQFENKANPEMHERTTAREILAQAGDQMVAFVAGVGTGGTITGVGRLLKRERPDIRIVAVEPSASSVLRGHPAGAHAIQGIGAGFVPPILDRSVIDEIIAVPDAAAAETARRLAREEGLLVGPSSGANVYAATLLAKQRTSGVIVTILCDSGERYFAG